MGTRNTLLRGAPTDEVGRSCPLVDQQAMAFVERYHGTIRWCINAYTIPHHDRSEVYQRICIRVLLRFRRLGSVSPDAVSSRYMLSIARSCCLKYLAEQRRTASPQSDVLDRWPSSVESVQEWLERREANDRLHIAVAMLPPMSRAVMHEVLRGLTNMEIAILLDLTSEEVKAIAHRARTQLRKHLTR